MFNFVHQFLPGGSDVLYKSPFVKRTDLLCLEQGIFHQPVPGIFSQQYVKFCLAV